MNRFARFLLAAAAFFPVWTPVVGGVSAHAETPPTAERPPVAAGERESLDVAIAARMVDNGRTLTGGGIDLPVLRRFYAQRGFVPLWVQPGGAAGGAVKPAAAAVLAALRESDAEGLHPADYHAAAIADRLTATAQARRMELDILLTDAVLKYGTHLRAGRVAPRLVSSDYAEVDRPEVDALALVNQVADAADPRPLLAALTPPNPAYGALKGVLKRLRAVERSGGWAAVPAPRAAKLDGGAKDPAVAALRRRLAASGDYDGRADAKGGDVFDAPLRKAVERFQARHGLPVTGEVNAATLAALNVPVADRIGQVVANMERARWLPARFADRHIAVNIPEYTLRAVDGGKTVVQMRVIVGTKDRRTPVLSSVIPSVVLNPTWTIPPTIARQDYLPKLMRNPGYLAAHGFTVYSGWGSDARPLDSSRINWKSVGTGITKLRLRQDPGPKNALGQVKFNIINGYDVYLHDTTARDKFQQHARALSSGCVRVGEPLVLADFVLGANGDWTAERRQQTLEKGATRTVMLKDPLEVHLLYQTVWVDGAGVMQVRDDIYGRDGELMDAIARRRPAQSAAATPAAAPPPAAVPQAAPPVPPVKAKVASMGG